MVIYGVRLPLSVTERCNQGRMSCWMEMSCSYLWIPCNNKINIACQLRLLALQWNIGPSSASERSERDDYLSTTHRNFGNLYVGLHSKCPQAYVSHPNHFTHAHCTHQTHMRGGLNWKILKKKTMESTVRMENSEKARARSTSDSGERKKTRKKNQKQERRGPQRLKRRSG